MSVNCVRSDAVFVCERLQISWFTTKLVRDEVHRTYLLGLLAMIKCSICSYQYDN